VWRKIHGYRRNIPLRRHLKQLEKLSRVLLWVQKENMAMVVKHISMSLAMETRAMVSRGELTFQDIYGAEALLNEEDEGSYSSDWEPVQQKMPFEFVKWCCFSCTMENPDTGLSPKLKRNAEVRFCFFSNMSLRYIAISVPHYLTSSNTKRAHVSFILILGNSSATSSTAVGFEEIMSKLQSIVNITSQLLYSLNALQTTEFLFTSKVEAIETTNGWSTFPAPNILGSFSV
ncbi:hypothetical protein HID58_043547, partial [Brassica napus]